MSQNTDLINQAINDPSISKNKKLASISFGIMFSCILFAVPLAIVYNFFYYKRPGWLSSVILFICTTLLGFTVNLMFYRMIAMGDMEAQINKMGVNSVNFVAGVTFAAFTIVAITLFAVGVNPDLVKIFENTFGFWYIHLWGLTDLCKDIFSSPSFDKYTDDPSNQKYFNYNFLITQIDLNNLQQFIEYASNPENESKDPKNENDQNQIKFPLDFDMKFTGDNDEIKRQQVKLLNLVNLKQSFGHYLWVYLSSIVALFVSMIGVIMG